MAGTRIVPLVDADRAAALPGQAVAAMCGHGERAATAVSVLDRAGHSDVVVLSGGLPGWSQATGLLLAAGA